uniref:Uncharacterized protein n=1 Tax=Cucumis melo TaxID=3656 RepID=A0A9I9EL74_CUCME
MGHWDVQLMHHHHHLHQGGKKTLASCRRRRPPPVTVAALRKAPPSDLSRVVTRPERVERSAVDPLRVAPPRSAPRARSDPPATSAHVCSGRLDQVELERGISRLKGNYCNLDLGASLLGKRILLLLEFDRANLQPIKVVPAWVFFRITTDLELRNPTGRQSSMDIDMIRVIRRDPRSPIVLVFPPGSLQTKAEVRARVSWRATRSDRGEP